MSEIEETNIENELMDKLIEVTNHNRTHCIGIFDRLENINQKKQMLDYLNEYSDNKELMMITNLLDQLFLIRGYKYPRKNKNMLK